MKEFLINVGIWIIVGSEKFGIRFWAILMILMIFLFLVIYYLYDLMEIYFEKKMEKKEC